MKFNFFVYSFLPYADFIQNSGNIIFDDDSFHRNYTPVWFKPSVCRSSKFGLGMGCCDIFHLVCWNCNGWDLFFLSGLSLNFFFPTWCCLDMTIFTFGFFLCEFIAWFKWERENSCRISMKQSDKKICA